MIFRRHTGASALAVAAAIFCGVLTVGDLPSDVRAQANQARLRLVITGVRNATGSVRVLLYDTEESWLEPGRASLTRRVAASPARITVTIEGIRPGDYAVSVFHDENDNGQLDLKTFPPMPREGVGTSNNARPAMSAPSWSASRFSLARDRRLEIRLRYL